ncbi:restriction endonuclease subunit R [Staphylococcus aureus]|nr:restriction endonuclease subunit R [Staphylococcus aureus]QNY32456.1 restriction endonuclease subunit R [Staphylococcus aureus]
MTHQSEYILEWEILRQLVKLGCERVNIYNVRLEMNDYLKGLGVLKHD